MLQKEAPTLNSASNLGYLALNIVAGFFFFSLEGRETERRLNKKLTCWSSPDSRHSWTCLTFLTTVKSYSREDNICQINLRHRKPWRISKSNRFDTGEDLEKSGMKITKIGMCSTICEQPQTSKKIDPSLNLWSFYETFILSQVSRTTQLTSEQDLVVHRVDNTIQWIKSLSS